MGCSLSSCVQSQIVDSNTFPTEDLSIVTLAALNLESCNPSVTATTTTTTVTSAVRKSAATPCNHSGDLTSGFTGVVTANESGIACSGGSIAVITASSSSSSSSKLPHRSNCASEASPRSLTEETVSVRNIPSSTSSSSCGTAGTVEILPTHSRDDSATPKSQIRSFHRRADIFAPQDLEYLQPLSCNSSTVVRARVRHSGLECAVKTLVPTCPSKLNEIQTELDALHGSLEKHKEMSRYIVDFYGAFLLDGQVRVAMEVMDGSFTQLMRSKTPIPEEVLASASKLLLTGVEYLHRALRVVHRDIKPSNVLFNREGCVKISDFGISTTLDSTMCEAATFIGTMKYMSPERLDGESYSFSADVWSVGIILLELAQGCFPYHLCREEGAGGGVEGQGQEEDTKNQFWQIVNHLRTKGPPRLSSATATQHSQELNSFLQQCLSMDKATRPTARQLLSHDWIVSYTLPEESLDEARLGDWLCTTVLAPSGAGHHGLEQQQLEQQQASLQKALDSLLKA